jgi:UDP-N-acetylmuramyl tripeptide synthase
MTNVLLDSRRLTGPNLFWGLPGAVLDVSTEEHSATDLIRAWTVEVSRLMEAVGWTNHPVTTRVYQGGASLVINAPIDVLYAACELNEEALQRALASLSGAPVPALDAVITKLLQLISEEARPELLALQAAAKTHQVPFLWDDDEVSVGFGKTAITWPADRLPSPDEIDWKSLESIPLGIVTGTNGKSTTVRLCASILAAAGLRAGITSTDYIRVGEKILDTGDYSGPGGARTLLRHPDSEAVVLEVARGGLLRRGIGVERANAALITNIAADHLGEWGIHTVEEMAEAKFIVRRALEQQAPLTLNADDSGSAGMAKRVDNRLAWFGLDGDSEVIRQQRKSGGLAAFVQDGWLVLSADGQERNVVAVNDIPITFAGAARYNIRNALGAMLMCHVLGVADSAIATGLKQFSGDADVNPGRGNLFTRGDIRIFIDFAHNEHGLHAVSETVRAFGASRYMVLMGQAGDRSDREIENLVNAACELKPRPLLVCDLPGYERGREKGVVSSLIESYAQKAGVNADDIQRFDTPVEGVRFALQEARPGDCLVLLALTQRDQILELVRSFVNGG